MNEPENLSDEQAKQLVTNAASRAAIRMALDRVGSAYCALRDSQTRGANITSSPSQIAYAIACIEQAAYLIYRNTDFRNFYLDDAKDQVVNQFSNLGINVNEVPVKLPDMS